MNPQLFRLAAAKGTLTELDIKNYLLNHLFIDDQDEKSGKTAAHYAAEYNQVEILKLLLDYNANLHIGDKQGNLPLHYATQNGHTGAVKFIIDKTFLIDTQNTNGDTALHFACDKLRYGVIELLHDRADATIENNKGQTPFMVLCTYNHHVADNDRHNAVGGLLKSNIMQKLNQPSKIAVFDRSGKFSLQNSLTEAREASKQGAKSFEEELLFALIGGPTKFTATSPLNSNSLTIATDPDQITEQVVNQAKEKLLKVGLADEIPLAAYAENSRERSILDTLHRLALSEHNKKWQSAFTDKIDKILDNQAQYDKSFIKILRQIKNRYHELFAKQKLLASADDAKSMTPTPL